MTNITSFFGSSSVQRSKENESTKEASPSAQAAVAVAKTTQDKSSESPSNARGTANISSFFGSASVQSSKGKSFTEASPSAERAVTEENTLKDKSSESPSQTPAGETTNITAFFGSSSVQRSKENKREKELSASVEARTAVAKTTKDESSASLSKTQVKSQTKPNNAIQVIDLCLDTEYDRLWNKYAEKQAAIVRNIKNEIVEEMENRNLSSVVKNVSLNDEATSVFPDGLVGELATLVQGSPLSLSSLSEQAITKLREVKCLDTSGQNVTPILNQNYVADKIKLIAERKPYFGVHNLASSEDSINAKITVDRFEDETLHYLWRWEITTLSILPQHLTPEVKKARAARRKIASRYKAIVRLLQTIDKTRTDKSENAKKQVTDAEERVLKFEREDEMKRLQEQEKENLRLEQKEKEEKRQEEARLKRELEKNLRDQERAAKKAKKEEEKRLRDEAKKKKEEEKNKALAIKEAQQLKEAQLLKEKEEKQRSFMASFFSKPKSEPTSTDTSEGDTITNKVENTDDGGQKVCRDFCKEISVTPIVDIAELQKESRQSRRARFTRKRTTKMVSVSVTVTISPLPGALPAFGDDGYYSERTTIEVPNKLKFLRFHEDFRPAYRGTWSKPLSRVSGRRPFAKNIDDLDYDVDSEAEWEEEDVGEGAEDLEKDDDDAEEDEEPEVDSSNYNFGDGWLADDDEIETEGDENNNHGQTKKLVRDFVQDGGPMSWYAVCSGPDWTSLNCLGVDFKSPPEKSNPHFIGISKDDVNNILQARSMQLYSSQLVIDMNPRKPKPRKETPSKAEIQANVNAKKHEMDAEGLKKFCHFVHGNTLTSKDKVIEGFRLTHPEVSCSRAEVQRKLDLLGMKNKINDNGALWEIKTKDLASFGIQVELKEIEKPPVAITEGPKNRSTIIPQHPAGVGSSPAASTTCPEELSQSPNEGCQKSRTTDTKMKKRKELHASAALFTNFFKKRKCN